ncbi:MAG: hypothetical protein JWO97_3886 [Acidobacteria bacterium]|nr:hypothetical protein [Acidobacteriota bacterium]
MTKHHSIHLRSERRRRQFSQSDVAALIGAESKATISRYERGRMPDLATALAYEVVFGVPVAALFRRHLEDIRGSVRLRAKRLAASFAKSRSNAAIPHRTRSIDKLLKR